MQLYATLIHKESQSCYGVSFPDIPGVITAGATVEEALANATEVLKFAAEGWRELTGEDFPRPRSLEELCNEDKEFAAEAQTTIIFFTKLVSQPRLVWSAH